ncbi:MAG TPA: hypothetical protein VM123_11355 [archaeon]|nr:hypothetical protein [archaeon]
MLRKGLPGRCTSSMAMMEITCLLHAPETGFPDFRASYGLVSPGMIYHLGSLHLNLFSAVGEAFLSEYFNRRYLKSAAGALNEKIDT